MDRRQLWKTLVQLLVMDFTKISDVSAPTRHAGLNISPSGGLNFSPSTALAGTVLFISNIYIEFIILL